MRKFALRRRFTTVAVIVLTTIATVVMIPAPASANVSQGYVLGVGDNWENDWDDEGPLSVSENNHSNVVAMWQQILWADGHLDWSGIDCWFGPRTRDATRSWKIAHSIFESDGTVTGIVGTRAFNRANGHLDIASGGRFFYNGDAGREITFRRAGDGIWSMSISGDVHNLGYNYANFDICT